jgi:hypothetical protein
MKVLGGALALAMMAAAAPAAAQDGWRLSGLAGLDYSTGDYGTGVDTSILTVPLGLRASTGPFRVAATMPYLRIEGAANVVGGGEGGPIIVDPGAPTDEVTREGFGDLSLSAAYTLPSAMTGAFEVDLSGRVKLPTSNEDEGLSTGETDLSVGTDVSYPLGAWTPFVGLGYRMPGDPDGVDLNNTLSASVGASYGLSDESALIFAYDFSQASSDAAADAHELFAGYSAPLYGRVNWTLYGIAGLSDGAPDAGAGILLSVPFM